MKSRLTNLLACPDCQARFRLEINAQRGDEVVSGILRDTNGNMVMKRSVAGLKRLA